MIKYLRSSRGMTLMEIMIVLGIIAVIGGILMQRIFGKKEQANRKAAQIQLETIKGAIEQFSSDNGAYPSSLRDLVTRPGNVKYFPSNGYVKEKTLKDPFGCDIQYRVPGTEGRDYDVYSLGKGCQEGGDGDEADIYPED